MRKAEALRVILADLRDAGQPVPDRRALYTLVLLFSNSHPKWSRANRRV